MEGTIVKGIGGFYYVKTSEGIIQTKGRGIFKKDGITLAVGDNVEIELLPDGDGIINSIKKRKNVFQRPPVANVDCFIITFAIKEPKPNFAIIDRFLVMAEMSNTDVLICVNKCDLASDKQIEKIRSVYSELYPVYFVSGKTGQGIDELEAAIGKRHVAFAGPSGAGKSTITNRIVPDARMETGTISTKTRRGKHTTRHSELFETKGGGMIFDTPGFVSFDLPDMDEYSLDKYFPEIEKEKSNCRFDNCMHIKEPDCAVKEAVLSGQISSQRYESYISNIEELKKRKKY